MVLCSCRRYEDKLHRRRVSEIYAESFSGSPYGESFSEAQINEFIGESLQANRACHFVAEIKEQIVGFTWGYELALEKDIVSFLQDTFPVKETGYIAELAVTKAFRRKGIGTMLVITLLNEFRELEFHHVLVNTHILNWGALKIYERCGFKLLPLARKQDLGGGKAYFTVFLTRPLQNRLDQDRFGTSERNQSSTSQKIKKDEQYHLHLRVARPHVQPYHFS